MRIIRQFYKKTETIAHNDTFKIAGEAENNSPLGFAACLSKNSKFKTPNSDGIPSDTIFAFPMLNTMS